MIKNKYFDLKTNQNPIQDQRQIESKIKNQKSKKHTKWI